jgi:NADH-quinone oxidoreductase subunit L
VVGAETLTLVPDPTQAMKLLWLVPVLPLAGAVVNLFFGRRIGRVAGWVAVGAMTASFAVAALAVQGLLAAPEGERLFLQHLFDWISVGTLEIGADLRLDALSATMILVVTGIGTLIHIYAIGYMHGDPRYGRFFAYLNLFVFFMLMLVLGANLLVLYLGWEGVGLCSYLLIGFWFDKTANANAAKKAFVTTRVGDTLMLIGLALIVFKFGTLDYEVIFGTAASTITKGTATAIALLLFAGAVGKSAQLPLHVWLPDAMAGPTPVSALIHAATMVTAGVYLVVRMHPIFDLSPFALTVVAITGLLTALYAGTCALAQDDIKRVLAYSTISQLGFMFLAAGLRAYAAAIFFLVAHAFYKAVMFLGAGSVMHGMNEETDLKVMGGLWRRMPITAITFTIGALALSGVPPLAGFWAKDIVLEVIQSNERWAYYVLGTVAALISALYMGRLVFLAFFGKARSRAAQDAHESPPVMWVPLVVLALGAGGAGVLSTTPEGLIGRFLEPIAGLVPEGTGGLPKPAFYAIALLTTAVGLGTAWVVYGSGRVDWLALRVRLAPVHRLFANGWYVDEYYSTLIVAPGKAAAAFTAYTFDVGFLDGIVNGIGAMFRRLAGVGRLLQTGFVRSYAAALFVGAVAILVYVGLRL